MSTPSKGALCADNELVTAINTGELGTGNFYEYFRALIIDSHTNAIADELAAALKLALPFICFSDNEGRSPDDYPEVIKMINAQRAEAEEALARYQQIKAKETP